MDFLTAARNFASPAIAATAGAAGAVTTTYILPLVGFGSSGVAAHSLAAAAQSVLYGATVPAGSAFSCLQSWGATGALTGTLGMAAAPVGFVIGGGAFLATKYFGS